MSFSSGIQHKRLVLVVEDQEINRDILESILEDYYDVVFACNGVEALEAMNDNLQNLAIVLLDLMMPVMDGFEVLERVSNDERMRSIPIIVLTAEKDAELRALQLGAADFIAKPFDNHEVILARVSRIIELSEGRRLIRATEFDPLTLLYTQGFFYEYAEQIVRYHSSWHMDAIAIDIDHFHTVNELGGREFGDKILCELANAIQDFLIESKGIASRVGADRFFVYCKGPNDYPALLAKLQRAIDTVAKHATVHARMGVSPWSEEISVSEAFDCARTACNMVRDNFEMPLLVYDDVIRHRELYQQRLLNDVWRGVKERQFCVYYQPKYNIQQDPPVLSSAEALVRWKHPELGMISPGDFIPLFERNGLISVVDRFVWEEAARQIGSWRDELNIKLPISVNVSRIELFDPELETILTGLVRDNGLEFRDLKLEVTESAYTGESDKLISVVSSLRNLGFEIEMDDFGSGYSSLNMISSLPIDVLKMDMRFIQNVEDDTKTFRMVELVLDVAKFLGVPVVAEGVENDFQLSLLKKAGCNLVQGFRFSPPLPAAEFTMLLSKEKKPSEGN